MILTFKWTNLQVFRLMARQIYKHSKAQKGIEYLIMKKNRRFSREE